PAGPSARNCAAFHRVRRGRRSPAQTAAIAPTTTAMSGRFSGADGVMSGSLTVARGEARTGSWRVNVFDAETDMESWAVTTRATDAPLGPPVDWARRPTLTVLGASTVRFARVAPTGDPPLGMRLTDHPNAV